jgi:lipopolysaccharide transport system permease protein
MSTESTSIINAQGVPFQTEHDIPQADQKRLALDDLKCGFEKWRIWLALAYQDIRIRYRRSVLGPFWLTLSMAISTYSMGYLYSHLFHTDLQIYFPFLVSGVLSWTLISGSLLELIDGLAGAEAMIKQIKLPYSLHIHRIAARHMLIFFHNFLVIIPVIAIFHHVAKINFNTLLLIPSLILVYINSVTYGLILGIIGARYRDVSQIIKSLIQVIFFLTPIMWRPEVLPANKQFIVWFNPFASFVQIMRAPLLGLTPALHDLAAVAVYTAAGLWLCYKLLVRCRARIGYWV